jgi:hypothetical protein
MSRRAWWRYAGIAVSLMSAVTGGCWPGSATVRARRHARGRFGDADGSAQVTLRIRYRDLVTPWWSQYSIPAAEMASMVEGTVWQLETHLQAGEDHAVLLRRG